MSVTTPRKLTLDDIADLRAYERERDGFRQHIKRLKQRRRIGIGPIVTMVFENRDTVRFQIQEMARIEKIISDEGIQAELDVYNPLIPEPGQLSATLFVELTSDDLLRAWLPKLVGIERSVVLRFGGGEVHSMPEEVHDQHLSRDDVTATVQYVRWELTPAQVEAFAAGPVELAIDHPEYQEAAVLAPDVVAELLGDLRP
jgi:hypothetical protein